MYLRMSYDVQGFSSLAADLVREVDPTLISTFSLSCERIALLTSSAQDHLSVNCEACYQKQRSGLASPYTLRAQRVFTALRPLSINGRILVSLPN